MIKKTLQQYEEAIERCRKIFLKKTQDYGTSWRVLRTSSITDQLFIKAQRIRNIEEKGMKRINEDVDVEFIGLVNYSVIGLIQLELGHKDTTELTVEELTGLYDKITDNAKNLMVDKNHDYGEAWRDMRVSSFTDLILMKLLRIRQIEDNKGKTIISEGIDAGFYDIINYAIFALIKIAKKK